MRESLYAGDYPNQNRTQEEVSHQLLIFPHGNCRQVAEKTFLHSSTFLDFLKFPKIPELPGDYSGECEQIPDNSPHCHRQKKARLFSWIGV